MAAASSGVALSGGRFKIKATFAYLMQRGARGASIEEIADLIWPKAHLTQSLNRLYHTIHCLRQLLLSPESPPTRGCIQIVCRNGRYYLSLPDGTWIDLPIFEQLCRQGEKLFRLGQFEQALMCCQAAERLYGGSLFSDIPLEYVENAELDWCWSQRFWIERMHLRILTYIAAIYRVRKDHELALRYCTRSPDARSVLRNRSSRGNAHISCDRQWRCGRTSISVVPGIA